MPSSAWRSTLFPYTTLFRSDRKSTRLNSSHDQISYAVFCLKKKITPARYQDQTPARPPRSDPVRARVLQIRTRVAEEPVGRIISATWNLAPDSTMDEPRAAISRL